MLKPDFISLLSTDKDSFRKISFYCLSTVACMKGHNYGCIANLHQCAKFLGKNYQVHFLYIFIFLRINPLNHRITSLKSLVLSRYYRSAIEVLTKYYRGSNEVLWPEPRCYRGSFKDLWPDLICYHGANVVLSMCYLSPTSLSFCCPHFLKCFKENLFCTFKFLFSVRFLEYDGFFFIQN